MPQSTRRRYPPLGGEKTGPDPTNRGKLGCKRHIAVDANGIPLAVVQSAANVNDCKMLEWVLCAMEPIKRPKGRLRWRPWKLHADKGYDFTFCREMLRDHGVVPRIARRGIESNDKLGCHRWKVERTLS